MSPAWAKKESAEAD
jgi:hypothetical protein